MTAPELLQRVQLQDGRVLAYARYGDPDGLPVLHCHGLPASSRLEPRFMHEAALRAKLQIIAIDRPGFGHSTWKPGRSILDWPDDIVEFADALGFERFAVLGASGGGPFAIACAYRIPERLTGVTLICSAGPLDSPEAKQGMMPTNRMLFFLARWFPPALNLMLRMLARGLQNQPEAVIRKIGQEMAEVDRVALEKPEIRQIFLDTALEGFRQGVRAAVEETRLYAQPWGFRLEDVEAPVYLFHGELDRNVPATMAHYLANTIPNCTARFYPDDGHLSLIANKLDEILAPL